MRFAWSEEKNSILKASRGVGFEDVVTAFEAGALYRIALHPKQEKYPGQYMLVIEIEGYLCRVPFVWQDQETVFLKTVYPSRKEMRKWRGS
jgi:hypothetical protein